MAGWHSPGAGAALGDHVLGVVVAIKTLGDGMAKTSLSRVRTMLARRQPIFFAALSWITCDQWRVDHMHRRVADRGEEIGAICGNPRRVASVRSILCPVARRFSLG